MNRINKYSTDAIKYNRNSAPIIVIDSKDTVNNYSTIYKGKHLIIDTGILKFYILTENKNDKVAILNDKDLKDSISIED